MNSKLKLISHSSLCLLHTCPRKYQLTKLSPDYIRESTVHTAFGSMFGEGVQRILVGDSLQDAIIKASLMWNIDIDDSDKEKSFWSCITALEKFNLIKDTTTLIDYEVAEFNGQPACELSFSIDCGDGFFYRGYVDIVLRHKITGSLLVVDVKSSNARYVNSAKYQNSAQAIGYSIVIDKLAPETSQYDVMYYEYLTALGKFVEHHFIKDHLQRAKWLRNIIIDIKMMNLYDSFGNDWPMHGESCAGFNRVCQFLDICQMELPTIYESELNMVEDKEYLINTTLDELINSQLER